MGLQIKTLHGVKDIDRAPDGGWGWVMVFAAFMNFGIGFGFPKTMGVYFTAMRDDFGTSNTAISWFITLTISLITFTGKYDYLGLNVLRSIYYPVSC